MSKLNAADGNENTWQPWSWAQSTDDKVKQATEQNVRFVHCFLAEPRSVFKDGSWAPDLVFVWSFDSVGLGNFCLFGVYIDNVVILQ